MANSHRLQGDDQLRPPLLDIESEPRAVVYWEFLDSGWGARDAAALADRTIDRIRGNPVELFVPREPTAENATLLDADSEPIAIFYWAFLDSGHSPDVAANYAVRMHRRVQGIEPEDPEDDLASGTKCQVYPARIVYCENGQRKTARGWVDAPCLESSILLCAVDWPECPTGEDAWFTLDLPCGGFPCSWVRFSSLTDINCTTETIDCGCFEDLDCEDVPDPQCCDSLHGCGEPGAPCPSCP